MREYRRKIIWCEVSERLEAFEMLLERANFIFIIFYFIIFILFYTDKEKSNPNVPDEKIKETVRM